MTISAAEQPALPHGISAQEMEDFFLAAQDGAVETLARIPHAHMEKMINAQDKDGWTALMWAVSTFQDETKLKTIQLLIEHQANIHARDKSDNTALIHAAANGAMQAVLLLLDNGADITAKNKSDLNAWDCADAYEQFETADIVLQWPEQQRQKAITADVATLRAGLETSLKVKSGLSLKRPPAAKIR